MWDNFICLGCRLPSSACWSPLENISKFSTVLVVTAALEGLRLSFLSGLALSSGDVQAEAGAVAGAGVLVLRPVMKSSGVLEVEVEVEDSVIKLL